MRTSDRGPELPDYGGMRVALPALTPVVKRLLIANAAIFLVVFFLPDGARKGVLDWFGLHPALWRDAFPLLPFWQLFTYGFLHAGPQHVLWNMLLLYFFGTMLEGRIGSRRFFAFFSAAVLAGGVVQLASSLLSGDSMATIGASGGVIAVVVAAAVLQPSAVVFLLFIPITLKWLAIIVVGLDVFAVLASWRSGSADGVARWAHLGGAAYGFFAARRAWIFSDPLARLSQLRDRSRQQRRHSDEARMDQLLAKIHREGMASLTRDERRFLKRVSGRR